MTTCIRARHRALKSTASARRLSPSAACGFSAEWGRASGSERAPRVRPKLLPCEYRLTRIQWYWCVFRRPRETEVGCHGTHGIPHSHHVLDPLRLQAVCPYTAEGRRLSISALRPVSSVAWSPTKAECRKAPKPQLFFSSTPPSVAVAPVAAGIISGGSERITPRPVCRAGSQFVSPDHSRSAESR